MGEPEERRTFLRRSSNRKKGRENAQGGSKGVSGDPGGEPMPWSGSGGRERNSLCPS